MKLFVYAGVFALLCCLLPGMQPALAQQAGKEKAVKYTLSGTVLEKGTGEAQIGARVMILELKTGAQTNDDGFFSLSLPPDTYTVVVSGVGFAQYKQQIVLDKNVQLKVELESEAKELETVEVVGEADVIKDAQMSVNTLDIAAIKKVPAFFGEVDVVKAIQLLPGIKSGTEGTTGFFVRGGSADQNLILLDGTVLYNPAHAGGLFSVFNSDAIQGAEIYKGNFPAQYGGRLSSVLDVSMREGNNRKFNISGGIGLISTRVTVEAPFKKEKHSFLLSARRSYIDVFTRLINEVNKNDKTVSPLPNYYFYDINAKMNFTLTDKDRLYVSGYWGQDVIGISQEILKADFGWGNGMGSVRWNRVISPKINMNNTASFSYYYYEIANDFNSFKANLKSQIFDGTYRLGFDYYHSPKHTMRWGLDYIGRAFNPATASADIQSADTASFNFNQLLSGHELAVYYSADWDVHPNVRINYGGRLSGFLGKNNSLYYGIEPRASVRYKFFNTWAAKLSYARIYQYIHLATSSTVTLPTDIWLPSSDVLKPQYSDQIAAGITKTIPKAKLSITLEGYYKWLHSQIEPAPGTNLFLNPNLDRDFVRGRGWGYGAELLIERKEGRVTGWVSYTLAWANRQFDALNEGKTFPFRYDRRHDVSIVINVEAIKKKLFFGALFVFQTGNALTLPVARLPYYDVGGTEYVKDGTTLAGLNIGLPDFFPEYVQRNSFRSPDYHRLDINVTYRFKVKKLALSELVLSIYNVYNRANPFFIFFDTQTNAAGQITGIGARNVALFPIIPSLTWNFKF